MHYDAHVVIDICSRYIVGPHVHARESAPLAEDMMRRIFGVHGIPATVHVADVHHVHAATVNEQRSAALGAARADHPERFSTTEDPKIRALPADARINRPAAAQPAAA